MPNKTAKPAAKATAAKPAVKPVAAKAPAAKPAASKAPVAAPAKAPVAAAKPAVKPAAAAPKVEEKKVVTQRQGFKANEFVVYPAHGVGQILAIEEQEIAGAKLELFVINFIKDKMTLRVPTAKVANVGMRKLSEPALVKKALETLKGRARVKRTMWSRRAQEYEAKINSGDIVAIAEVVRDLYRSESQPEQSYSERQLYEAALDRLSREIAVVQHSTETEAVKEIEAQLAKSPRRTNAKAEAADGEGEADADGDTDGDDTAVADEAA
jgi:CarD family transcriptional regulator